MAPTLEDGEIIITNKPRSLRPGLIYVVNHPELGRIIKRLKEIDNRGLAILSGDNPSSTSQNLMGAIAQHHLTHRAWLAIGSNGLRRL